MIEEEREAIKTLKEILNDYQKIIDVPEPGVYRMFIHSNELKFYIPYKGCSAFQIEVVEENNARV